MSRLPHAYLPAWSTAVYPADRTIHRLQTEFAGLLIASIPDHLTLEDIAKPLKTGLEPLGLSVHLKRLDPDAKVPTLKDSEPFVLTTAGPDRLGLIGGMAEVMAHFGVNITNLKAVFRGGTQTLKNVMNYELDVPRDIDHKAFRDALQKEAEALGLEIKLVHREAIGPGPRL